MGRDGQDQARAGGQQGVEIAKDAPVVGQVLQHVEQTDQVEAGVERGLGEVGADQWAPGAPAGEGQTLGVEVHADHDAAPADLLEDAEYVAGAAADLEHAVAIGQGGGQALDQRGERAVAGAEPEVPVLDRSQRREVVRIIHCHCHCAFRKSRPGGRLRPGGAAPLTTKDTV